MQSWATAHYIDYQSGWERKLKDRARWYSRHERMAFQRLSLLILSTQIWEVSLAEVTSWSRPTCQPRRRLLLQTGTYPRHQGLRRPHVENRATLHYHPVVDSTSTLLKESRRVGNRIMRHRGEGHHCLRRRKLDRHHQIPLVLRLRLGQRCLQVRSEIRKRMSFNFSNWTTEFCKVTAVICNLGGIMMQQPCHLPCKYEQQAH